MSPTDPRPEHREAAERFMRTNDCPLLVDSLASLLAETEERAIRLAFLICHECDALEASDELNARTGTCNVPLELEQRAHRRAIERAARLAREAAKYRHRMAKEKTATTMSRPIDLCCAAQCEALEYQIEALADQYEEE